MTLGMRWFIGLFALYTIVVLAIGLEIGRLGTERVQVIEYR